MSPEAGLEQIADRLKAVTREGGSVEAAQVKVIGLDEIRVAAGPRWPRMRERVRDGSLSILQHHTGPDDVVIPAGDGFLVILADGPPGETQRKCQQMRDALVAFYLGEDALKSLRADVKGRSLSADGLSELIASSMGRERAHAHERPHGIDIAFARVFVAHEQRVGALLCAPLADRRARRIGYNLDFMLDGRHHQQPDFTDVDLALVDESVGRMETPQPNQPRVLGLTVHASTMQVRKAREHYLAALDEANPDARRHMFITIAEIEKGTPLISITEWVSALRQRVSHVWLDLHYTDHAISSLGGAGAWAAGFHLPSLGTGPASGRAQRIVEQVSFWSRTIRSQSMRLFVNGFRDHALLSEASARGVDFATSDALWPFEFAGDAPATQQTTEHAASAAL